MTERHEAKVGDRIKVSFKGVIRNVRDYDHRGCTHIETDSGHNHYVYFGGQFTSGKETPQGVTVELVEPPEPAYLTGRAYIDADGDVFIRNYDDGWTSASGTKYTDSYASRPLRLLTAQD